LLGRRAIREVDGGGLKLRALKRRLVLVGKLARKEEEASASILHRWWVRAVGFMLKIRHEQTKRV
jgi:hypothetical protein